MWDLGANTGRFSRLASEMAIQTVAFDNDPAAVEKNYLASVHHKESKLLPLVVDLRNPSSMNGWANSERMSLEQRGPADVVLALALIHHLAISNNVPLHKIAGFFRQICRRLIIEFVPKSDKKVMHLLATREDVFPWYTQERFEIEFAEFFDVRSVVQLKESDRVLYLMERR